MNGENTLLWWVIPGVLAGMPMPFIHSERRLNRGGALDVYDDDLPKLSAAGIKAIVSLLNIPSDASIYESAGFDFIRLPVPDGGAPTLEQMSAFVRFVDAHRAIQQPVVVHCQAGLGRTGTMLAAYLIAHRETAEAAIQKVRSVERGAIETPAQIHFLEEFARLLR